MNKVDKLRVTSYLGLDYGDDTPFIIVFEDGALTVTSSPIFLRDEETYYCLDSIIQESGCVIIPHPKGSYMITENIKQQGVFSFLRISDKEYWAHCVFKRISDMGYSDADVNDNKLDTLWRNGASVDYAVEKLTGEIQ